MKLKTLVLAGAVAGAFLAATPGNASANIMWCVGDPPTQVVTPAGNRLTINTSVYAPDQEIGLNNQTTVAAWAGPDGSGGTLIYLTVHAPNQDVIVVSSVQRVRGATDRKSGSGDITMVLDVPIA